MNITETFGVDRENYAVIKNLTFVHGISNCNKEIRVMECSNENGTCFDQEEIPFDILSGDNSSWCEVEFPINLTSNSWRTYYIYYGNKEASEPDYGEYEKSFFSLFDKMEPYGHNTAAVGFWIMDETQMHMILTDISTNDEKTKMWKFNITTKRWNEIPVEDSGRSGGMNVIVCLPNKLCYSSGEHEVAGPESIFIFLNNTWEYLGVANIDGVFTASTYSNNYSRGNGDFSIIGGGWNDIIHIYNDSWKVKKSDLKWHVLGSSVIEENLAYSCGFYGISVWNGSVWKRYKSISELNGVDCWDRDSCWFVGNNGKILELYNNSIINFSNPHIDDNLNEVFMTGNDRGYIIGDGGIVLRILKNKLYYTKNVTYVDLGKKGWRYGGPAIFMKNDSFGWIGGREGIILFRGGVNVDVLDRDDGYEEKELKVVVTPLGEDSCRKSGEGSQEIYCEDFYLEAGDPKFFVEVFNSTNQEVNIEEDDLNVNLFYDGNNHHLTSDEFNLDESRDGYIITIKDFYQKTNELGTFNISVSVHKKDCKGKNTTKFYFLKVPKNPVLHVRDDWKEVLGASATGRPVIIGTEIKMSEEDENYTVNDLISLEKMFLKDKKRILIKSREKGIFAPRIARKLNEILVFEEGKCSENCLNLENMSYDDIEDLYLNLFGKSNYFILVNVNKANSVLAGEVSIYRRGMPIIINLGNIKYPSSISSFEDLESYNKENNVTEIRRIVKNKIEKFSNFKSKDYVDGESPRLLIIGNGKDVPYFLVEDFGWEDVVLEPSGNELWLKTDSFYGDLNGDKYQDLVVGRINKDLKGGLESFKKIVELEDKEPKIGIGAEYNHIEGMDLLLSGGSMLNGFIAEMNLRNYPTKRIVERRLEDEDVNDELLNELKKIILKSIDKNFETYYSKISFSKKMLYNLLERNWFNWRIGTRPEFLDEMDENKMKNILEEYDVSMFFGSGDSRMIYLPNNEALNIEDVNVKGFSIFDHSFSGLAKTNGTGFIGNMGILHDISSREFWSYFFNNIDLGVGGSFAKAKNNLVGGIRIGSNLTKKEYYEKVLMTDPGVDILKHNIKYRGYHSARRYGRFFIDEKNVEPKYEFVEGKIRFFNYSFVLLDPNRPIIPVYKESVVLPSGSQVLNITYKKSTKKIDANMDIFRDEYYIQKSFIGTYPQKDWWMEEREFLDGRREIIFYVPIVYNGSVLISNFSFDVIYDSPLEITEFEKINSGFHLVVFSNEKRTGEIFLDILGEGEEHLTKNVTFFEGRNDFWFDWKGKRDSYISKIVIVSDANVGPRLLTFQVKQKPNLLIITSNMIKKVWTNLFERMTFTSKSNGIEVKKTQSNLRFESWIENGKKITSLKGRNFSLYIVEDGSTKRLDFKTKDGRIVITKSKGETEEKIFGDENVKKEFERAKFVLKDTLNDVR